MDDKIVKINLSVFQKKYDSIKVIPQNISEKVVEIKSTHACFNSYYDPKMIWAKKFYNKKEKNAAGNNNSGNGSNSTGGSGSGGSGGGNSGNCSNGSNGNSFNKPKNRFHIIIPDFSERSIIKRNLVGFLNKLTLKNKESIYEKIKDIITFNNDEEYFMIIWSYIKISEEDIYINLLELYDGEFLNTMITKLWHSYNDNKEWMPPQYIYDNNLLLLNNEYELYCDYIKWKKGIHNINRVWLKFKLDEIPLLLDNIYNHMCEIINERSVHKYIIDIFMEQLYKILSVTKTEKIIDKVRLLDIKKLDNSTKFYIYNILDLQK
jgi:hypothetical protein